MTQAQIAAREQIGRITLKDIGRRLNSVAAQFLGFWGGDAAAAKRSLRDMRVRPQVREMLSLAMDTVTHRRQRQLNRELDGLRIRRGRR